MDRVSRIIVAADGTLLLLDDTLCGFDPLATVLPADDELRVHAEALMAAAGVADGAAVGPAPVSAGRATGGGSVRADALRPVGRGSRGRLLGRTLFTTSGALVAVEVALEHCLGSSGSPDLTGSVACWTPLDLNTWCYPEDLGAVARSPGAAASMMAADTGTLLLPGLPDFVSGVTELFALGRAARDLRFVRHDSREIRTLRFYGWVPDAEHPVPLGVGIDISDLAGGPAPHTRFAEALLSTIPDSLVLLDVASGRVVWTNGHPVARLGYDEHWLGSFADLVGVLHPDDRDGLDELGRSLRRDPASGPAELRFRLRDASGRWRWMQLWVTPWTSDPDGSVVEFLCTLHDVDQEVQSERQMAWEASHDPLTGLANRRVVGDTLQAAADDPGDARRHVYFIDLDDFKRVNDAYGHAAGDDLLCTLAARISALVAPADVVGRFGGDEVVIVSSVGPDVLGERLLSVIRRPVTLLGAELTVTTSIGVAAVGVTENPDDVVQRSNEAMYRAKRAGGNRYAIAGPLNTGPAQRRVEVESDLRRAVRSGGQLQMVFQPIVRSDRVPVAAEALLRWDHPVRGLLRPSQFLDIAEAAGLMGELSELIVRESIAAVTQWSAAGRQLMVTVNAGRRQLGSGRLTSLISDALDRTGTPPAQVCVEVTESVLVDAGSPELAELWRLRELGLEIALDDFGTGYAPLTYLKRLPATILKLDKSFVTGLGLPVPNPIDLAVSRAVADLAGELGMQVIAEGVESERQMQTLSSIGYRAFQGFWAHAPMRSGDMFELLIDVGSSMLTATDGMPRRI